MLARITFDPNELIDLSDVTEPNLRMQVILRTQNGDRGTTPEWPQGSVVHRSRHCQIVRLSARFSNRQLLLNLLKQAEDVVSYTRQRLF